MAKHKKRKSRRGGRRMDGIVGVTLNGLIPDALAKARSITAAQVVVGALAGVVGVKALSYGIRHLASKMKIPGLVLDYTPFLGGVATAGGYLYLSKSPSAPGHAVGALLGGLIPTAFDLLQKHVPQLAGVEAIRLNGWDGFIVNDNQRQLQSYGDEDYDGFIVNDNQRALQSYDDDPQMEELAQLSMGADDDGLDGLIG